MGECIGAFETRVLTDYRILLVAQPGRESPDTPTFAVSKPGLISLCAGRDPTEIVVRLERWDADPGAPDRSWQDADELPWLTVDDEPRIHVSGFEAPEHDGGLDIQGLRRARVQVLAARRDRHLFDRSTGFWETYDPTAEEPERWLLRFWPDPDERDALAGPPRRIGLPKGAPAEYLTSIAYDLRCELIHLARWSPAHRLVATPRQVATRLTARPDQVIENLARIARELPGWFTAEPAGFAADTIFELAPFG